MAHNIYYDIFSSRDPEFTSAVRELIALVRKSELVPIRLVFYGKPNSNSDYCLQRAIIGQLVVQEWGSQKVPLVSYVAQHPTQQELALEVQMVGRDFAKTLEYKQFGGVNYIVSERADAKLLYTEGIVSGLESEDSIQTQSINVLRLLEQIMAMEGMPLSGIIRQWNYIERITAMDGDTQHYQAFNDARSHLYAKSEWPNGYPAATGIGTDFGGIMVEVDAQRSTLETRHTIAIDNPLQVAAHNYSQQVLLGQPDAVFHRRTTPKFERAKAIVEYDCAKIYISGTAAIRGEESLSGVGIEQQTIATLENIEYLISKKNLARYHAFVRNEPEVQIFRVYLKFEHDMPVAKAIIEQRYPYLPTLYVLTDVCREELLIEIEGVAQC